MNSFEMNKIIGAILGTILLVMGVGFLAEAIYAPIEGRGPGYNLPVPEEDSGAGNETTAEPVAIPLAVLLASASPDAGASVARKCQSCHNFDQGAGSKVGPELYGVVGRQVASEDGFGYSDTLTQMGGEGTVWTYENLNEFLTSPKAFAEGTKMSFAGLRKETDRADILAYLQTLSAMPVAFPVAEATTPPATDTAAPTSTPDAPAASDAVSTATDVVNEAADAADSVAQAVTDIAQTATDTASEAVSTATNTVEAVVETATEPTTPAASEATTPAATETTAPAASETATPAATETAQAETSEAPPADAGENAALYALIANGSVEDGARVSRKCQACHSLEEGGRNKVGPVLYNIVGGPVAANETFKYSDAFKALGAEGKVWTFEMLDSWLTKPRDFVPGTKMSFGGLRKEEDRANLIAYLRTLSASPVPLSSQ